jgi:hypothetical protein
VIDPPTTHDLPIRRHARSPKKACDTTVQLPMPIFETHSQTPEGEKTGRGGRTGWTLRNESTRCSTAPHPATKETDQSAPTVRVEKMAESAEIVHEEVQDVCQEATES